MSTWTDLGLPYANRVGYTYAKDLRLVRSPYQSALPDQKQLSNAGKKTFKIAWTLTPEQINIATLYLLNSGFEWFNIELVSETGLALHEVRLIDKFETTPISGRLYKLSVTIETRIDPVSCVPITCDTLDTGHWIEFPCDPEPICDGPTEIIYASGLYPINVLEESAVVGRLIYAWMIDRQLEQFQPGLTPLGGLIIHAIDKIIHEQAPDSLRPAAIPLAGLVYPAILPFPQAFESYEPHAIPLNGGIIPGIFIRNPVEFLGSRGNLVCDVASFLTFTSLGDVYRGCILESNFVDVPSMFADETATTTANGEFRRERFAELTPWSTAGTVMFRDRLQLRVQAPLTGNTSATVTVNVGEYSGTFTVTTLDCSSFTNYIDFGDVQYRLLGYVESGLIIVPECELCNSVISITEPGEYRIRIADVWSEWTSLAGTVNPLEIVQVRLFLSDDGVQVSTTLTINEFSGTFTAEGVARINAYVTGQGVIGIPQSLVESYTVSAYVTGEGVIGMPGVTTRIPNLVWTQTLGVIGQAQALSGLRTQVSVLTEGVIGSPQITVSSYEVFVRAQALGVIGTASIQIDQTIPVAIALTHVNEYAAVLGPEYVPNIFATHINEYAAVLSTPTVQILCQGVIGQAGSFVSAYATDVQITTHGVIGQPELIIETVLGKAFVKTDGVIGLPMLTSETLLDQAFVTTFGVIGTAGITSWGNAWKSESPIRIGNVSVEVAHEDYAAFRDVGEVRVGNVSVEVAHEDYATFRDLGEVRIGNVSVEVACSDTDSYPPPSAQISTMGVIGTPSLTATL